MNKRVLYVLVILNIILLFLNLYLGFTRNSYNYLNIFSNILIALGMYFLAKKQK